MIVALLLVYGTLHSDLADQRLEQLQVSIEFESDPFVILHLELFTIEIRLSPAVAGNFTGCD